MIDKLINKVKNKLNFNSKDYWENRYRSGGNSGAGSYGEKAKYKALITNNIIEEYNIKDMIEFGCGDGNNLAYYNVDRYIGFDVSETAIKTCINKFNNDTTKSFILYNPDFFKPGGLKADLTISYEVIFHLIEDEIFLDYISNLFDTSSNYVLICSSNNEKVYDYATHVKHRKFTDFIPSEFSLLKYIKTPIEELNDFFSDFYLYQRR